MKTNPGTGTITGFLGVGEKSDKFHDEVIEVIMPCIRTLIDKALASESENLKYVRLYFLGMHVSVYIINRFCIENDINVDSVIDFLTASTNSKWSEDILNIHESSLSASEKTAAILHLGNLAIISRAAEVRNSI